MVPIVLVPGLLCDADVWAEQLAVLGARASVHAVPFGAGDTFADEAAAFLRDAPPRFALAGHSMGGYFALEVVRQAPERVERLALLDTNARPDRPEQTERRLAQVELARERGTEAVSRELLPIFLHETRLAEEPLVERCLAMARRTSVDLFERQQRAIIARPDARDALPAFACPTLVLCGDGDRLSPPELSEEMAALVPGAVLTVVPACGHMAPIERPNAVAEALAGWAS